LKHLVVISDLHLYSQQGAAFARLRCYLKAIGDEFPSYITTCYTTDRLEYSCKETITNNVYFIRSSRLIRRSKLYRKFLRHFDFYGLYLYLKRVNKLDLVEGNFERVYLFYGTSLILHIIALLYLRLMKSKTIYHEKSELELAILLNQNINFNLNGFMRLILFPLKLIGASIVDLCPFFFCGELVISKKIQRLYCKGIKKVLYIPILYDLPLDILSYSRETTTPFLIGYTGTISRKKDGLIEFLKALTTLPFLSEDMIQVNMYGEGSPRDISYFAKELIKRNLSKMIHIHKPVESAEVHSLLKRHDLLILTRSSNLQTEYGFSTKLAEYLASGTPVLATNVSDNSIYLKDLENALMVDPGDINGIAEKIKFALENKKKLKIIGKAGELTAKQYFHYALYHKSLKDFLFN
jgi:glycosyltransferase involved in cell wall biosynthesis